MSTLLLPLKAPFLTTRASLLCRMGKSSNKKKKYTGPTKHALPVCSGWIKRKARSYVSPDEQRLRDLDAQLREKREKRSAREKEAKRLAHLAWLQKLAHKCRKLAIRDLQKSGSAFQH